MRRPGDTFLALTGAILLALTIALALVTPHQALAQVRGQISGSYNIQAGQVIGQPPVIVGRRVAVMGDSISANAGITVNGAGNQNPPSGGWRTQAPQGYVSWLPFVSQGQIEFSPDGNFAVSGYTTTQILATLPAVLAYKPNWVILEGGTNDPGNSITYVTSVANLTAIYTGLTNAGINIVRIMVTPRQAPNGFTTAQNQGIAAINTFDRRWAVNHGNVILANPTTNGFGTLAGGLVAGTNSDGLHPNQAGAKIFADTIWTAWAPFWNVALSDQSGVQFDLNDTYDATNNPTGNMLSNVLFTTTTGGTIGTNTNSKLTGSVPGSFTASFTGAAATYTGTLAMTTSARSDYPGTYLIVTATSLANAVGGATGAQDKFQIFQQLNLPAGVTVGSYIVAEAQIVYTCSAGGNGFDVDAGLSDGNGTTNFQTMLGPASNSSAWPQGGTPYTGVLRTQKFLVAPPNGVSTRTIQWFVNLYFDTSVATGGASCTVKIASPNLHVLAEP